METKRVARRNHSAEFRAQVLAACREPDASVAAIAMRNGLNANVIYRWLREEPQKTQTPLVTPTQASQVTSFLPVQLPGPVAKPVTVTAWAEIRMEAITSRALLLASVGRAVKHAEQTTLYLTPMHAAIDKLLALIANIRAALSHVRAVAEQLPQSDRWKTFLGYVVAKITRPLPQWLPPDRLALAG